MSKPRRRKARQPLVRWQHIVHELAYVERNDGRLLALAIHNLDTGWSVMAVEGSVEKHALDVLDDHANQAVAKDVSERVARRRATEYARTWLKSKNAEPNCECGEIKTLPKKQRKAKASKR